MAESTITELCKTYRKMSDLMQGGLPERVIEMLRDTSADVQVELAEAQAKTWAEFAEKVAVLIGALPLDPTAGWLMRLKDAFCADISALPVSALAEAAE